MTGRVLAGIVVVTLPAGIDLDSAEHVYAALTQAQATGVTVVVADMSVTAWCNLEGVAALLRACRAAEAARAELRLAAVQPAVPRRLEVAGTSGTLPLYLTVNAAMAGGR
jgi:anti-anti-sigma factor